MAQALHILVDGRILLDVRVRLRDIRLWLVVVVVGHEVLHRVIWKQAAELIGQLRGKSLVGRHHQGGTLGLFNEPGRSSGLTGTRGTEQHNIALLFL